MNATVTARIPLEIKKQVDAKLKGMGSSPTELINAAYSYVLEKGSLPGVNTEENHPSEEPCVKRLTAQQAEEVRALWKNRAILHAPDYNGENFKELLHEAKDEYYARFA